jgi:hypothetical protein
MAMAASAYTMGCPAAHPLYLRKRTGIISAVPEIEALHDTHPVQAREAQCGSGVAFWRMQ